MSHRLAPVLVASATALCTLSAPAIAQAGPSCFTKLTFISWVTGAGGAAKVSTESESKAVVRRPRSLYRWDLGAWVGGMGLHAPGEGGRHGRGHGHHGDEDVMGFGGMGLQARYRMRRHWGIELSAGALHSEGLEGTSRDMMPVTASLMYYLTPTSLFQIYGVAGLGVAPTRWYDTETDDTIGASTAGIAQAGVGVALDLHPLRLNADIRGLAMKPSLGDEDGPAPGALACTDCRSGVMPADSFRDGADDPLAGTSVHLGASIVF